MTFSFNKNQEFLISLHSDVELIVEEKLSTMSNDDCVQCIRDIVGVFLEAGMIHADAEESVQVAIEAHYIARIFQLAFARAYSSTSDHLDNVEQLNKAFKL